MRVVSLFSGAGGFEVGLGDVSELLLVNDLAPDAQKVLRARFPQVHLVDDVRSLRPCHVEDADLMVAGFPCQDVSIVGGQQGLAGTRTALVEHVFRLASQARHAFLLLENVQSIRFVHHGRVLLYLMHAAEAMGYAWAYRTLDSRAFDLPQRRRRFYFLAARNIDPGDVMLADAGVELAKEPIIPELPIGFYWTEGRAGHGLTSDAIPPLKAGSGIGIPSPPAVLMPDGGVKIPTIETAERLQGFEPGWTDTAPPRLRWRLIGNAVSPPVIQWIVRSMENPLRWDRRLAHSFPEKAVWPLAAWGDGRGRRLAVRVHEAPSDAQMGRLSGNEYTWVDLSNRALRGFVNRARASRLTYPQGFLDRLERRLDQMW